MGYDFHVIAAPLDHYSYFRYMEHYRRWLCAFRNTSMKNFEELYCGGISPRVIAGQPSVLREKLRELMTANDQRMLTMQTDAQKLQFEKCREAADEFSDLVEREAFTNDVCLAVKITAKIIGTMEVPDIDE